MNFVNRAILQRLSSMMCMTIWAKDARYLGISYIVSVANCS